MTPKQASNYVTIVRDELDARVAERNPPLARSVEFDILASEVAVQPLDLTHEEVEAGLTDGGGDGGIDSAYVFVNQELVDDEHEILQEGFTADQSYRRASVSLWLVQAKEEMSFKSGTIVTLSDSLRSLLDLDKTRADLESEYSTVVLDKVFQYRQVIEQLRLQHPQKSLSFYYVTLGNKADVANAVLKKIAALEDLATGELGFETATSSLIDAADIWRTLGEVASYSSELRVTDFMSHESGEGDRSYVCIVSIGDYLAFLREDDGTYREYLFDGNVRHHEGSTATVNREIREGLGATDSPEFWWLNNGVTVICSSASTQGKKFALDDVQIVNGLQTSRTIYDTLKDVDDENDALSRHILVRILESQDSSSINKVIRATNRQTPVKEESLRATDEVQLMVEQQMLKAGLFYDRRRNFYRNSGKPRAKIVSVKSMTQALLAIVHSRPDDARARPGDYLKDDDQYQNVFNVHAAVAIYPWVTTAQRIVDAYLAKREDVSVSEKNDSHFLIAADVIRRAATYRPSAAEHILSLGDPQDLFTEAELETSLADLRQAFANEQKKTGAARDRLAKSKAFSDGFLNRMP
jgi:hypothetical protein